MKVWKEPRPLDASIVRYAPHIAQLHLPMILLLTNPVDMHPGDAVTYIDGSILTIIRRVTKREYTKWVQATGLSARQAYKRPMTYWEVRCD